MCGLVGLFYRSAPCDPARITSMRDRLVHRGPDDGDNFVEGPLGLGHRRLSIVDLGGGHQPMFTEDGRFVVVYNGEIYNYPQLRRELETQGVHFRTHSDTEVILHLHAREGDAGIAKLNGIFAYAIWDREARRLLLVRDRAGIKPLYYTEDARGVAFASEIKALFASDLATPAVELSRLAEYLTFRQVAGAENLFRGILSLPPGHTLEIREGRASTPKAYWTVRRQPTEFKGSFEAAVDQLDSELNSAVKRQLMSDVPLGTFCSGGIDSSLTTAIAARHATAELNTFSVGFHEQDFDESAYARMAAAHCHTTHHELRVDEREYAELLPRLIYHHDLPLNFANSVHIYAVSQLARKHVTVVLTGEGADELFGGYPRYYIPRMLQPLRGLGPLLPLFSGAAALLPDHRLRKLAAFARQSPEDVLLFNSTGTDREIVQRVLRQQQRMPLDFRRSCIEEARKSGLDEVSVLARLDFQTYLVSILNRQDKMSMAASIEARVPFLDNEIIDFAQSLPLEYRQTMKQRKRVLCEVALRYLPAEIVHRRKSGFGVPLAPWFANSGPMGKLVEEAVHSSAIGEWMDAQVAQSLLSEHRAGRADHSELLWGILNLRLWRQAFAC